MICKAGHLWSGRASSRFLQVGCLQEDRGHPSYVSGATGVEKHSWGCGIVWQLIVMRDEPQETSHLGSKKEKRKQKEQENEIIEMCTRGKQCYQASSGNFKEKKPMGNEKRRS